MKKLNVVLIAFIIILSSCDVLEALIGMADTGPAPLTNSEIVAGLKDALNVGTKNVLFRAGNDDIFCIYHDNIFSKYASPDYESYH